MKEKNDIGMSELLTNDTTIHCDRLNLKQKYAICLMNINVGKGNSYEKSFETCRPFLRDGTCPAMKMREEEVKADRAIYYKLNTSLIASDAPRAVSSKPYLEKNRVDKESYGYMRGRFGPDSKEVTEKFGPTKTTKVKIKPSSPKPKIPSTPMDMNSALAEVVTEEMEKENKRTEDNKPFAGESPKDYLTRLRRQANDQNTK